MGAGGAGGAGEGSAAGWAVTLETAASGTEFGCLMGEGPPRRQEIEHSDIITRVLSLAGTEAFTTIPTDLFIHFEALKFVILRYSKLQEIRRSPAAALKLAQLY